MDVGKALKIVSCEDGLYPMNQNGRIASIARGYFKPPSRVLEPLTNLNITGEHAIGLSSLGFFVFVDNDNSLAQAASNPFA